MFGRLLDILLIILFIPYLLGIFIAPGASLILEGISTSGLLNGEIITIIFLATNILTVMFLLLIILALAYIFNMRDNLDAFFKSYQAKLILILVITINLSSGNQLVTNPY